MRKDLRRWLRALHDEFHFTSVFVTHDQEEALELSDQVVVMSQGQVEQVDSPTALYARPESRFVFDFLGHVNVLSGAIQHDRLRQGAAWVRLSGAPALAGEAQLYLRPHEVRLVPQPTPDACLPFVVESVSLIGAEVRVELTPDGWHSETHWEVGISHGDFARRPLARGDRCHASPDVGHLFPDQAAKPLTLQWQIDYPLEEAGSGI